MASVEHERAFIAELAAVTALIAAVMPPDDAPEVHITDYHMVNSLVKLFDVRAKLRRAAAELANTREADELVAVRDRRMKNGAKGAQH